jgi:cobalt-zinc-cadmium efflux system membrane fusion protein
MQSETGTPSSAFGRVAGGLFTLAVVELRAVAAYWGHATGWTFARSAPAIVPSWDTGLATVRPGVAEQDAAIITFDSAEVVERVGLDVTPAWTVAMTEAVSASGEVGFDPARLARLSARAGGSVHRVFKTVGDRVKAGEVLALVDAAAVGRSKAEFLQALVRSRLKRAARDNLRQAGTAVSEQRVREAEAAVADADTRLLSAEQALVNLGLPLRAEDYATLSADEAARQLRSLGVPDALSANLLPVVAPFAGVVLTADVVAGEVVEPGKVLFVVVDPSQVWLTLHVQPEDAERITAGQSAAFRPDGVPADFVGRVAWIGTAADETTRTIPVRVELPNAEGRLRASMFGRGRIILREEPNAVVVPHEAVHSLRGAAVVFVRDENYMKPNGPKAFHVRRVQPGTRDDRYTEIRSGLSKGEVVATRGSKLLLAEWERSAIGR